MNHDVHNPVHVICLAYTTLVGGLEHFLFSIIYGIILPIRYRLELPHVFRFVCNRRSLSGKFPRVLLQFLRHCCTFFLHSLLLNKLTVGHNTNIGFFGPHLLVLNLLLGIDIVYLLTLFNASIGGSITGVSSLFQSHWLNFVDVLSFDRDCNLYHLIYSGL